MYLGTHTTLRRPTDWPPVYWAVGALPGYETKDQEGSRFLPSSPSRRRGSSLPARSGQARTRAATRPSEPKAMKQACSEAAHSKRSRARLIERCLRRPHTTAAPVVSQSLRRADIAPSAKRAIIRSHLGRPGGRCVVSRTRDRCSLNRVTPGCSSPCGRPYSPSEATLGVRRRIPAQPACVSLTGDPSPGGVPGETSFPGQPLRVSFSRPPPRQARFLAVPGVRSAPCAPSTSRPGA